MWFSFVYVLLDSVSYRSRVDVEEKSQKSSSKWTLKVGKFFNVIEKRGPVFFPLVFASFIKMPLGKPSGVFAYAISRKQSEA